MRGLHVVLIAAVLLVSATAWGQGDLAGRQQYPQFRVLSGLSGGGFSVSPDGHPDPMGAAALATPIGYGLGSGDYAVGIFNTGAGKNPFVTDRGGKENRANGSAYGMFGSSFRGFRLTVSGMVLSFHGDSEMNLQLSAPVIGRLGIGAGVQDIFDVAGAGGQSIDFVHHDVSRSMFLVGTYALGKGSYVSVGKGERRFQGVFGNASAALTPRLRALVEYDSFNFNAGLLYDLGRLTSLPPNSAKLTSSVFLGAVRGKYGTAGLNFAF